jgi:hypothetical protein
MMEPGHRNDSESAQVVGAQRWWDERENAPRLRTHYAIWDFLNLMPLRRHASTSFSHGNWFWSAFSDARTLSGVTDSGGGSE